MRKPDNRGRPPKGYPPRYDATARQLAERIFDKAEPPQEVSARPAPRLKAKGEAMDAMVKQVYSSHRLECPNNRDTTGFEPVPQ